MLIVSRLTQHYRKEAARIRLDAKRFTGEDIRHQLLDIADQYERLAESLDLHAANGLLQGKRSGKPLLFRPRG